MAGDRDFKINILADASKFALEKPADELDRLADAAKDTGTGLDRLGSDVKAAAQHLDKVGAATKDASRDLDRFATGAKQTANQVDDAFDKIAAQSKRVGTDTRDGLRDAETGLTEFKDESADTAREAAASFTGSFEDVGDTIQEILANSLVGFGPMGMAAGIAAASGIGVMISSLTDAADKANRLGEEVAALAGEIHDAGGSLNAEQVSSKMKEWALQIEDQRSMWEVWQRRSTTNLEMVAKAADKTGVSLQDMFGAMSGMDSAAALRTLDQLSQAREKLTGAMVGSEAALEGENSTLTAQVKVIDDAIEKIREKNGITEEGVALSQQLKQALGEQEAAEKAATKAREDAAAALEATNQAYTDGLTPMDEWTAAVEKTGNAAKVTAEGILGAAQEQTQAMLDWAANLHSLAEKVPADVFAELSKLGPGAADYIRQLNAMTNAELQAWVANQQRQGAAAALATLGPARQLAPEVAAAYRVLGAGATQAYADGLLSQMAQVREAARAAMAAARNELTAGIRVQLGLDTTEFYQKLALARVAAKEASRAMP